MSQYKMAAVHPREDRAPEVHHYMASEGPAVSLRFHGANVFTTHEQNGSTCEQRIVDVSTTVYLTPEQAHAIATGILAEMDAGERKALVAA